MKKIKADIYAYGIIVIGFIARLIYILNTTVYERGHDVGYYQSLTDNSISIGHLGYIEYIAKFGHLPDFDPFDVFIFYHPPLNHIFGAIVVRISTFFGAGIDAAFENVQFLILFYSTITMILAYLILKMIAKETKHILFPLTVFCFHPSLIYMTGSINNDMLSVMFEILAIYLCLKWLEDYKLKYLLLTGLSIGLGMCAKESAAILAFPVGFMMLLRFIEMVKDKKTWQCVKEYIYFGLITVPIGMWWTIRNWVLFRQTPGVPTGDETDIKYLGFHSWWEQFGWPGDWGLDYPFHTIYSKTCSNSWVIMFRTAMFTEMRPDVEGGTLLALQILFVGSVVFALACAVLTIVVNVLEIKRGNKRRGIFLLSGYISFIILFIAFIIKYQFTCSADFRYIAAILIFASTSLVQARFIFKKNEKQN